VGHVKLYTYSL